MHSDIFTWVVLPSLIFLSRICDVTIGTLRIIFVSRGQKYVAPLLGFFEVLIWLIAMGQIMQNLDNVMCYIAYAGGFAMGNFIGIMIEEKIAIGILSIRMFVPLHYVDELKKKFVKEGFGITSINGKGANGEIAIIFSIFKRKDLFKIQEMIHSLDSKIFYSIEDLRSVNQGIFPGVSFLRKRIRRSIKNKK